MMSILRAGGVYSAAQSAQNKVTTKKKNKYKMSDDWTDKWAIRRQHTKNGSKASGGGRAVVVVARTIELS